MKYASIAIVVLIVLGIGGVFLYSQNNSSPDSMMKKDEAMMDSGQDSMEKPEAMMEKGDEATMAGDKMADDKMSGDGMMASQGGYMPYSETSFEAASDKKRVLFFFANWCPTCKPIDAELSASTAKLPAGVEVFRVNYNDTDTDAADKALAAKYGVTYQHTFVQVDAQSNAVTKWNGGGLDKIVSSMK